MPKQQITVWLQPPIIQALKEQATRQNQTLSQTTAHYVAQALEAEADAAGLRLLVPEVQATLRQELAHIYRQLSTLLARTALESATARRLVFQLLAQQFGPQEAKQFNAAAWAQSLEGLKKPLAEISALLEVSRGNAD